MSNTNEQKSLEARQKYILAFNDTMIKIWKEQITLLDVIDTRRLLMSPILTARLCRLTRSRTPSALMPMSSDYVYDTALFTFLRIFFWNMEKNV